MLLTCIGWSEIEPSSASILKFRILLIATYTDSIFNNHLCVSLWDIIDTQTNYRHFQPIIQSFVLHTLSKF